jgi:hypothetical protein
MGRLAALLALVTACHSARSPISAQAPTRLSVRILGDINPDSAPPSCRAHGGASPVPSEPPVWLESTRRDVRLDSLGAGQLVVRLTSARSGEPFGTAGISLESPPSRSGLTGVGEGGWARLQAPGGRYSIRVRAWVVTALVDSVVIRRGYADTLKLVVGQPWQCYL